MAIGGIDESNVAPTVQTGADVVAVISAITRADDPEAAAAALLRAVKAARVVRVPRQAKPPHFAGPAGARS